jgi:hypothetical protein
MTLSLDALGYWELMVLTGVRRASGSFDERDAQITRSGLYGEYPAIVSAYVEVATLADNESTRLEALKRAVFLAWYACTAPSVESGISELPETIVRLVMDVLDKALAAEKVDNEMRMMLAWYRDTFAAPFEHYGPVRALDLAIRDVTSDDVRRELDKAAFGGRGQLGIFWAAMLGT